METQSFNSRNQSYHICPIVYDMEDLGAMLQDAQATARGIVSLLQKQGLLSESYEVEHKKKCMEELKRMADNIPMTEECHNAIMKILHIAKLSK